MTYNITAEGEKKIRDELGITTIYDLRSAPEIADLAGKGMRSGVIDGVSTVHVPAFPEQDYSPEGIAARYADYAEGRVEVCAVGFGGLGTSMC